MHLHCPNVRQNTICYEASLHTHTSGVCSRTPHHTTSTHQSSCPRSEIQNPSVICAHSCCFQLFPHPNDSQLIRRICRHTHTHTDLSTFGVVVVVVVVEYSCLHRKKIFFKVQTIAPSFRGLCRLPRDHRHRHLPGNSRQGSLPPRKRPERVNIDRQTRGRAHRNIDALKDTYARRHTHTHVRKKHSVVLAVYRIFFSLPSTIQSVYVLLF